ncbi:hypothetical protein JCM13304A_22560 [Desulfothermus okinawensis JCM 13304]
MDIPDIIMAQHIMVAVDTETNIQKTIQWDLGIQNLIIDFRQNQNHLLLHPGFHQNIAEVGCQGLDHQDFLEVNDIWYQQ